MPHLSLRAPAKINLVLAVGRPAPPRGYHPIASLFACINLFDDLTLTPLSRGESSRHEIAWADDAPRPSPIDWPVERDLTVRAHRALELHLQRELPIHLALSKRIPVGAGLGGGSSDAAAALLGLNRLFNLNLPTATLASIASTLGSDIPFFLDDAAFPIPRPALVTGFGERIERLPLAPSKLSSAQLLLLLPDFGCPTGPVYQAFDQLISPDHELREREVHAAAASWQVTCRLNPDHFFNDLAPAAERAQPELAFLRRQAHVLVRKPVHITGSGSAMFIYYEERELPVIEHHAKTLRANLPRLGVLKARLA